MRKYKDWTSYEQERFSRVCRTSTDAGEIASKAITIAFLNSPPIPVGTICFFSNTFYKWEHIGYYGRYFPEDDDMKHSENFKWESESIRWKYARPVEDYIPGNPISPPNNKDC